MTDNTVSFWSEFSALASKSSRLRTLRSTTINIVASHHVHLLLAYFAFYAKLNSIITLITLSYFKAGQLNSFLLPGPCLPNR